jgi:molybdopterin-containing oxidoreductase family iron-sulfur binding subunit
MGQESLGQVAKGVGFNVYSMTSSAKTPAEKVTLKKTGETYSLALTQNHFSMEGRNLIRHATIDDFMHNSHFAHAEHHGPKDVATNIYPGYDYSEGYSWGMSINLNACTGCNACVVACQSENNIPTVGKEEVQNGREMHWIRVDRYYEGDLDNPKVHHQPVMCMHCENAPCEPVCPVGATTHSNEGLNEMTYNRCVGTRYCANNCPYKVRKFNFYEYADKNTETLKMQRNPDVTVRARGVMEKCTFCVQRINSARIESKKENRKIKDGEIKTACQSSCPTDAIVFGDLNTKGSEVSKLKASDLNYGILTELNTLPRLTYLAKVTNPNTDLVTKKHKNKEHHGH